MYKNIIFLFIFKFTCIAQDFKKEILIDVNNDTISGEAFLKKAKDFNFFYKTTETDSFRIAKLYSKINYGTIDSNKRQLLCKELKLLSNKDIDSTNIIVVNFAIKNDDNYNSLGCLYHFYHLNSLSLYKQKRYNYIKQFYIKEKGCDIKLKKVIEDKNNKIKDLFFDIALYCGNTLIIFPDNTYKIFYGDSEHTYIEELKKYKNE